ncbi:DUF2188 domain-containing protein [Arthrobacter sp. R4]|uniref:DUF2188 domain-containing protein n=1 Tax=Arthrobacter sp. R4 TaxID=644417 RepID=UPI003ED9D9FE
MTKPSFTGAHDAAPERPQVFNTLYLPIEPNSRSLGANTDPKPWHVTLNSATEKQFRTHAKAIRYATKLARKGKGDV